MTMAIAFSFQDDAGSRAHTSSINPLSPNIHIQILQADLYIFP